MKILEKMFEAHHCLPRERKLEHSPGILSVEKGGPHADWMYCVMIKGAVLRTRMMWVTLGEVGKLAEAAFPPLQHGELNTYFRGKECMHQRLSSFPNTHRKCLISSP